MEENNDWNEMNEIMIEPTNDIRPVVNEISGQNFSGGIDFSVTKSIFGWATFRAVIDIISGGFIGLGGLLSLFLSFLFFLGGSSLSESMSRGGTEYPPSAVAFYGVLFLVLGVALPAVGVFVILAGAKLIKTVDNLKMAISSNNSTRMNEFFKSLNKFFKFSGFSSIIRISATLLSIIIFIILCVIIAQNQHSTFYF